MPSHSSYFIFSTTVLGLTIFCMVFLFWNKSVLTGKAWTHSFSTGKDRGKSNFSFNDSPWNKVPQFEIYVRVCSHDHSVPEYRNLFLKGYRHNFPPERWKNTLVLGFDEENEKDHAAGQKIRAAWPYPRIFYHKRPDNDISRQYHLHRHYWDQFHPELFANTSYVGYAESATFFSSTVTPGSLFKNGKPLIIGEVGRPNDDHWPKTTRHALGHREIFHCRSYFPLIFRVEHIVKLRRFIEQRFNKPFGEILPTLYSDGLYACQYSIMCNYVWQYHRKDYEFRLQLVPDDTYSGAYHWQYGMELFSNVLMHTKRYPERWLPTPRIALFGKRLINQKMENIDTQIDNLVIGKLLRQALIENFCLVIGHHLGHACCKWYNQSKVAHYLYQFEHYIWTWDRRCFSQQTKYLTEARRIIQYQQRKGLPLFGVQSKDLNCQIFEWH